jgi:hypothetical protein
VDFKIVFETQCLHYSLVNYGATFSRRMKMSASMDSPRSSIRSYDIETPVLTKMCSYGC